MKEFAVLLRAFEHELGGDPVEMAIVIRDTAGKNPDEIEAQMRAKIEGRRHPFRLNVRLHAVRNAMGAWLLADFNAIRTASRRRQGKRVTKSHDAPEGLLDPKGWFRRLLTDHKVGYTAKVCSEKLEKPICSCVRRDVLAFVSWRNESTAHDKATQPMHPILLLYLPLHDSLPTG
jgi:hypothetical protein